MKILRTMFRSSWFRYRFSTYQWYRKWYGGRWECHCIDICRNFLWLPVPVGKEWPHYRQPCSSGVPIIEDYRPDKTNTADIISPMNLTYFSTPSSKDDRVLRQFVELKGKELPFEGELFSWDNEPPNKKHTIKILDVREAINSNGSPHIIMDIKVPSNCVEELTNLLDETKRKMYAAFALPKDLIIERHPFGHSYSIVPNDNTESLRSRSVLHPAEADPEDGAGRDS